MTTPATQSLLPVTPEEVRGLAVTVASIRQGRSCPPRCESPSKADIIVAEQAVKDVLRAIGLRAALTPSALSGDAGEGE